MKFLSLKRQKYGKDGKEKYVALVHKSLTCPKLNRDPTFRRRS